MITMISSASRNAAHNDGTEMAARRGVVHHFGSVRRVEKVLRHRRDLLATFAQFLGGEFFTCYVFPESLAERTEIVGLRGSVVTCVVGHIRKVETSQ